MFTRNPSNLPPWPHWIETPQSITLRGRYLSWLRIMIAIWAASIFFLVLAWISAAQPLNQVKNYILNFRNLTLLCGIFIASLMATSLVVGILLISGRVLIVFYPHAVHVRTLRGWTRCVRAAGERLEFFVAEIPRTKANAGAEAEIKYAAYMGFGLNNIRLGSCAKKEKADMLVVVCQASNEESKNKQSGTFEVQAIAQSIELAQPGPSLPTLENEDER